jgi:hypothetical protein
MMTVEPRRGVTPYKPREGAPVFLSDMIIELGFAEKAHVEAAVETARSSGETVGHILVRQGALSEDQLARALAARYGLNHVDLDEFDVDPAAANLLPPQAAQRYHAVPIGFESDGGLVVAMADPSDSLALTDIAFMTGLEVHASVAAEDLIKSLVGQLPLPVREGSGSSYPTPAPAPPVVAAPVSPTPETQYPPPAPEPAAPPVPDLTLELATARVELDAANAALDAERSKHAQSVAELRQKLAGEEKLREELAQARAELDVARQEAVQAAEAAARAVENAPRASDIESAERRVSEAHATLEKMRRDFENEREHHASTERDLRAKLASETERHEALKEEKATLQKRVDALRTQNAALLDAYATAKRWSAEFARGARELADTLEQPVLDDAVRAQQQQQQQPPAPEQSPPAPPPVSEGPRFSREDDDDSPSSPPWLS